MRETVIPNPSVLIKFSEYWKKSRCGNVHAVRSTEEQRLLIPKESRGKSMNGPRDRLLDGLRQMRCADLSSLVLTRPGANGDGSEISSRFIKRSSKP